MRHYILGALRISTLVLAVTVIAAGAQEMKPPQVSGVYADWQLAVELAALDALNARREETSGGEPSERPLDELNAATGTRFPNIAAREGEIIGKVGNFLGGATATTYHLHFDLQVPTKYGWVFVNPYMTLVASYERLIEARG